MPSSIQTGRKHPAGVNNVEDVREVLENAIACENGEQWSHDVNNACIQRQFVVQNKKT